jgi:tRNA uridine 5-carbamoylmethylation protein Kti12
MNNTSITPTSLAKKLILEFMLQNQNKNKSIPKKDIQEYVKNNWSAPEKLTAGIMSGALYDLCQSNKLENPIRGYYLYKDKSLESIQDLKTEIRRILSTSIQDIQKALDSIDLEQLNEDDYPYINQINDLTAELLKLLGDFIFPPKKE